MRETRVAQASIFEFYAEHEFGDQLKALSSILDEHPEVLSVLEKDLIDDSLINVGRSGLTVESIFRCLLLKQLLQVSYKRLAFHLADSMSYRTFSRLPHDLEPKKSCLQSTIRRIKPETLEEIFYLLSASWITKGIMSIKKLRIDSTVVKSNIAPPLDSQLLNDGVRVLSRNLARSRYKTGIKIRFTDQRKKSTSLAFRIFNAKKAEKDELYEYLIKLTDLVLKQSARALLKVRSESLLSDSTQKWISKVEHYMDLTQKVLSQTVRRVILEDEVPASEKILSIFEEHTDIIVKSNRDTFYGHKINLSSEVNGFITHLSIEDGNTSDKELFMPVLNSHQKEFGCLPESTVCDGGYATKDNVLKGRELGLKHVVFHKRVGLSYHAMGVKKKTFDRLRNFRAGIEGNISELKRAYGVGKAKWKGRDGFEAFVWSSVISYNLVHLARIQSE